MLRRWNGVDERPHAIAGGKKQELRDARSSLDTFVGVMLHAEASPNLSVVRITDIAF